MAAAASAPFLGSGIARAAQAVGEPMNLLPPGYIDIVDEPGRVAIPGEEQLAKHLQRTPVFLRTTYPVGSVIVDTSDRYLYLTTGPQKAFRYGVGVGKDGFQWDGLLKVSRKAEWPSWRPPADMLRRAPDLPEEVPPGPLNPLGARALYLYDKGKDSLYRIHGTNLAASIGGNVTSGCFRLTNRDVMELYPLVLIGAKVIVK